MEYPFCDQTVTVYRGDLRQVICGCYLEISQGRQLQDERPRWEFLLVVPCQEQRVFPGDLLIPGIGPEILTAAHRPIPVTQVRPYFWNGSLTHIEAT